MLGEEGERVVGGGIVWSLSLASSKCDHHEESRVLVVLYRRAPRYILYNERGRDLFFAVPIEQARAATYHLYLLSQ